MGYSIDRTKKRTENIRRGLDERSVETGYLEEDRQELLDELSDVKASHLDEETKGILVGEIRQALADNSRRAQDVSREIDRDRDEIADMELDTQESMESNLAETASIEDKQVLLDRVGLADSLDGALSELDWNRGDLEDVDQSLDDTELEAAELVRRLHAV